MSTNETSNTDERLARFWRRKPLLLLSFAIIVTLTVFFGALAAWSYSDWRGRFDDEVEIRPWMRPTYIARINDVERQVIFNALDIERGSKERRLSIAQIARIRGVPVADLIDTVEDAIDEAERYERR